MAKEEKATFRETFRVGLEVTRSLIPNYIIWHLYLIKHQQSSVTN